MGRLDFKVSIDTAKVGRFDLNFLKRQSAFTSLRKSPQANANGQSSSSNASRAAGAPVRGGLARSRVAGSATHDAGRDAVRHVHAARSRLQLAAVAVRELGRRLLCAHRAPRIRLRARTRVLPALPIGDARAQLGVCAARTIDRNARERMDHQQCELRAGGAVALSIGATRAERRARGAPRRVPLLHCAVEHLHVRCLFGEVRNCLCIHIYRVLALILGVSALCTRIRIASLMCALSFCGMLFLENHKRSGRFSELLLSAVVFGCASATRSNGILLSLYIAWHRLSVSPSPVTATCPFLRYWIVTALLGAIAIGPQIAYFVYGMLVYCPSLFGSYAPLSLLTDDRSWCAKVIPNFSAMYMFIQSEYWNVGLFKYYELKQIPNFLLAAPILILSAYSLFQFFQAFWSSIHRRSQVRTSLEAPYYVHWLFLLVNALLVVHIQVTTRLLSACPPLFWAPAAFMLKRVKNDSSSGGENSTVAEPSTMSLKGKLVIGYFLLYCMLGAVLFPSFYPWT